MLMDFWENWCSTSWIKSTGLWVAWDNALASRLSEFVHRSP